MGYRIWIFWNRFINSLHGIDNLWQKRRSRKRAETTLGIFSYGDLHAHVGVDSFGNSSLEIICHKKITGKGTILSLLFFPFCCICISHCFKEGFPSKWNASFFYSLCASPFPTQASPFSISLSLSLSNRLPSPSFYLPPFLTLAPDCSKLLSNLRFIPYSIPMQIGCALSYHFLPPNGCV